VPSRRSRLASRIQQYLVPATQSENHCRTAVLCCSSRRKLGETRGTHTLEGEPSGMLLLPQVASEEPVQEHTLGVNCEECYYYHRSSRKCVSPEVTRFPSLAKLRSPLRYLRTMLSPATTMHYFHDRPMPSDGAPIHTPHLLTALLLLLKPLDYLVRFSRAKQCLR
jgi:hypothetical protein